MHPASARGRFRKCPPEECLIGAKREGRLIRHHRLVLAAPPENIEPMLSHSSPPSPPASAWQLEGEDAPVTRDVKPSSGDKNGGKVAQP